MKRIIIGAALVPLICVCVRSASAQNQTSDSQALTAARTALEQQLQVIEQEIQQDQQQLTKVQSQKNTLANKIRQLKIQQAALVLKIQQASLSIDQTTVQIFQTKNQIDQYQAQITASRKNLADTINQLWRSQPPSLLNVLLTASSFSDFYGQAKALETVSSGLNAILQTLQVQELAWQAGQQALDDESRSEQNYFSLISLQKSALSQNINDQNGLLQQTKGKEANYQKLIQTNSAQADAIRGRIYSLIGTTQQITFGQAVTIAQWASSQTGVRAAFLLAILTQESNLGKNVGTCNRAGDPPSKSWKVVMKPDRDQAPFLQITQELGLNPNTTPVSCPMKDKNGNQLGWGGALGPAQFIPSTWMGYRGAVSAVIGKAANPWDIRDAFLAAAIKLKAGGAGSVSGEWAAAMYYFSGSTNPAYSFYGDNVVAMAAKYQDDINQLGNQ